MQEVLKALNRLVADGIVENYAIGGAVGASFYIEAVQTEDVDAFVFLPPSFKTIASLSPIYQSLQASGGTVEKEHVRFGEWPLQILPDANPLISEAIRDAVTVDFNGTPTRFSRQASLCYRVANRSRQRQPARYHVSATASCQFEQFERTGNSVRISRAPAKSAGSRQA